MSSWLASWGHALTAPAFLEPERITYGELVTLVATYVEQLSTLGVRAGTRVAFGGDHGAASCALLLALVELRAVLVPIPTASRTRDSLLRSAGVELVIVQDAITGWSSEWREAPPVPPLVAGLVASNHAGLVVFSSGSTGQHKAALHDFARLLERYRQRRRAFRVLAFLKLDHLGGVHTVLHTLANGGAIVAVADRSPDAICAAIERHRVQLLPVSPTFVQMLLVSEAHLRHDLSSLELVTYGTEPMPEATLARLRAVLPTAKLQQTYGLTELGVFPTRSRSDDTLWLDVGGPGVETKIIDGELWIRSHMAMLGYLDAPSPFDADGWFNTHDRVVVDGTWLRILGRDSDVINVGGEKVWPAAVESVLLSLPNVRDALVHGISSPVTGHVVAAKLVLAAPEDENALRRRVREECAKRLPRHHVPVRVQVVDSLPTSDRLKKDRTP